jgi:uncharacterized protein YndB with AHSA1/START domain
VILDLSFDEHFDQPIEEVWRAITDRALLARWLMENDFEPRIGGRFTMDCGQVGAWDGIVHVEVLELDPPHRMVWSWSDGVGTGGPSRVWFELRREGSGTRLTLRHTGPSDDEQGRRVDSGWPVKLASLRAELDSGKS